MTKIDLNHQHEENWIFEIFGIRDYFNKKSFEIALSQVKNPITRFIIYGLVFYIQDTVW